MAATTNRWKLGLFVTVGVGVGVGAVFWLAANALRTETFPAVSYFDESVQGLEIGSPVKFRGVTIGSVSKISVAEDRRHVEVTADLHENVLEGLGLGAIGKKKWGEGQFAPPELRVQIVPAGITGLMFLQVDFFDPAKHPPRVLPFDPPWNYVPSERSTLKRLEYAVLEAVDRFPRLGDQVSDILERLDKILNDLDIEAISLKAQEVLGSTDRAIQDLDTAALSTRSREVLADASRALGSLEGFIGNLEDEEGPFLRLVGRLDHMTAELEGAIEEADLAATASAFRDTSAAFAAAAQNTRPLTEELAETLSALRSAADAMRALAELLERDPAALIHGRSPSPQGPGR